ncbi:MAG: sporulation protein YunB [Clostridia bacterium]|nr:sporulation protein YunB [Clostridia bacterium]
MFRRKRPLLWTNRQRKPKIVLMFFVLLLLGGFWLLITAERSLGPTMVSITEAKSKQIAVEIIHRAIKEEVSQQLDYQDLMLTHKDEQGHLVMVQPDIAKIDRLQAKTTLIINERFKKLSDQKIGIPLGQLLGSKFFANIGPQVRISVKPVGTVNVRMVSGFEEAGINQTRHTIALRIEGRINIVIPLLSSGTKVTTDVLIADNVFFGQVPNIYLNSASSQEKRRGLGN